MSGEVEGWISGKGAQRSFGSGDVGIFCDGGDEMGCEVGV